MEQGMRFATIEVTVKLLRAQKTRLIDIFNN